MAMTEIEFDGHAGENKAKSARGSEQSHATGFHV
jgi:hypothetical protein